MRNPQTGQLVTTYTLTPSDLSLNDGESRYQRVLEIIRRDLTDQKKHSFQKIGCPDSLSCDLAVSKTVEPGDQDSHNPILATLHELHGLAEARTMSVDAESSNPDQDNHSP